MENNEDSDFRRKLTVSEIAELAGVSIATVSRVINGKPNVRRENVKKVERVLTNQLSPIPRERSKSPITQTIGLIVPDIANPWFPTLIKGVENVSRLRGLNLVLSDSENDSRIESKNIETMVERNVAGLIVVPTNRQSEASIRLVESGFPVVFLDRQIEREDINFVTSKNRDGAYQATKYLISLGHRSIVYVAGNEAIDTEWKRRSGFLQAVQEAGIGDDGTTIINGNYDLDTAKNSLAALLESQRHFTAVFASDDVMAYGVKAALDEVGLRVPTDISLVGFDDIAYSSLMKLTTVSQSSFELGKNAILLLDDILSQRIPGPKRIELPTSMVIRDSCAPAMKSFTHAAAEQPGPSS